ncbi:uncharacterized protein LOC121973776 [Zingiber officinale]|uniref:Uncharacterized protein n=1 Tax=Zingiber officinale TaxID=94328 RepID=A0A8J5HEM5_ZINOF|nr:uncharacterized protein LOC121973776 [Zingiber officinale]KAG6516189.1 hypothetical protein ZIOFF_026638 [Zingiber officinale]
MATRSRTKRATAALGEDAKARLVSGYAGSSSGSEHETAFSSLVHAFFECDADDDDHDFDDQIKFESNSPDASLLRAAVEVADLVRGWTEDDDPFRLRLLFDVSAFSVGLAALRLRGTAYRSAVMTRLRERGYNAGVCKVRWESARNLIAGSYEYVDVVTEEEDGQRYIVELSFAAEFEVARGEKGDYKGVTAALPEVAVARPEELLQVVRVAGKAARRSLEAEGLHVPPWRKTQYMAAKWLGPYRRTTNGASLSATGTPAVGGGEAKCQAVVFAAAATSVSIC